MVTPRKGLPRRSWILGSTLWILNSTTGFRIPQQKFAGFRILQQDFTGFRNPHSVIWGDAWANNYVHRMSLQREFRHKDFFNHQGEQLNSRSKIT